MITFHTYPPMHTCKYLGILKMLELNPNLANHEGKNILTFFFFVSETLLY